MTKLSIHVSYEGDDHHGALNLFRSLEALLAVPARLTGVEASTKEIIKMGQKTNDAITALEAKFQGLGNSILKEVQQLKDAQANGTDDPAAIARLEALGTAAAGFTSDLDADDPAPTV